VGEFPTALQISIIKKVKNCTKEGYLQRVREEGKRVGRARIKTLYN
jgi:hypothetical protein